MSRLTGGARWQGVVTCAGSEGGTAGGPANLGCCSSGRLRSRSLASFLLVVRKEFGEHSAVTAPLTCRQAELVRHPASHVQWCAISLLSWRPSLKWFAGFSPQENTRETENNKNSSTFPVQLPIQHTCVPVGNAAKRSP